MRAYTKVLEENPSYVLQLGDQDIFNAAIALRPELVSKLPCGWNLQDGGLSTFALTQLSSCLDCKSGDEETCLVVPNPTHPHREQLPAANGAADLPRQLFRKA